MFLLPGEGKTRDIFHTSGPNGWMDQIAECEAGSMNKYTLKTEGNTIILKR